MSLFGFGSLDELKLFETLISVSGLGPKTGMAMLSAMSADQVAMAIASGSVEILTTIPGIGKKTADRLILELKDKVGGVMISSPAGKAAIVSFADAYLTHGGTVDELRSKIDGMRAQRASVKIFRPETDPSLKRVPRDNKFERSRTRIFFKVFD